ncbi:MAG TPA: DUF732 domain-containing protein [Acidimicrobiales bacterium]|nr:DUF732 domain-containing protein [Acidimicrobiales bacterium]
MAVVGLAWFLVASAGDDAKAPSRPEVAFVSAVRAQPVPVSLQRSADADLVALGRRFCEGLRRTGSSLAVVFEDQLAGRVYDGQSQVVTAARRHLCPELPDRDS